MLQPYVIDSSVYISSFLTEEAQHPASKQAVQFLFNGKQDLYVPSIVVAEVFNVLRRSKKYGSEFLGEVVRQFLENANLKQVTLDSNFLRNLVQTAPAVSLKTSDLIVVFTAVATQSALVTWDKNMIKHASKYVTVRTPDYFCD